MSQPHGGFSDGQPKKLKFLPKKPARRTQEERDRVRRQQEAGDQELERRRENKNTPCRYFWLIAQGWNNCRKGYDCEHSHDTKNPPRFWEPRTGNARDPVFKFTEWTFNHSLARKTKKQERETEMLKQAEVQGQAEVQSQPEGQATPSVKRQASKNATRVPKRPAIDPIRPKRLSRLICAHFSKFGKCNEDDSLYQHIDIRSTMNCKYFNNQGGCQKGPECPYNHVPRRPQRPPLQNKTTQYTPDKFQKGQILLAEQALQQDDTLWQLVLSERERLKRAIEEAREVANWDTDETYRDGQEEVRLEDVRDAVSGLEGQSVPPVAGDEPPNEVQRGDFDAIFWSIYSEFSDQQQQILKVKRLDELIWNSFGAQTQQLFIDSCTDDRSRLLRLPEAEDEEGIGWYLGVVTDLSQPVQEDYLVLYVGQSINISKRVKRHLIDRRHKFSAQYEVTRRGDKRVQYVTLGTISKEDVTKEEQKAILNYGELLLCLFFQTLPETKMVRYLPEDAIRTSTIGLNSQNPMGQEIRDLMCQPGSSKWASIDVPQAFRDKRQDNMDGIHYKSWIISKRLSQGTYRWARDPELVLGDDPHIMVRCGRCRGIVGQDRVPLYARDDSGYIVRRFVCKECRNSGHGSAYFYPIDPQIQYEQMPRYKVKYYRAHPDLRAEDEKAERTLMDSRIKEMLEKGFHEDMDEQDTEDEQDIEDEGVSGSRGVPGSCGVPDPRDDGGPRDSAGPYGARKWTGNLRTRLLGNRFFHCKKPESQPGGRVFFREVTITVPEAAGFDCDVRVRCDLKRAGEVHPNVCAVDTVPEDPARRLGIEVTYRNIRDGSEKSSWCFLGGEQNAKKLNSLVDFLEQKPDGYTVQQPRRCLPKSVKYGRSKATYTS